MREVADGGAARPFRAPAAARRGVDSCQEGPGGVGRGALGRRRDVVVGAEDGLHPGVDVDPRVRREGRGEAGEAAGLWLRKGGIARELLGRVVVTFFFTPVDSPVAVGVDLLFFF